MSLPEATAAKMLAKCDNQHQPWLGQQEIDRSECRDSTKQRKLSIDTKMQASNHAERYSRPLSYIFLRARIYKELEECRKTALN